MGVVKEAYNKKKGLANIRKEHRRGNFEGAISQRKSDNRWQGEVIVGFNSKTSKKIKKYVYAKSREECLSKVQDLTYQVRKNTYFEPSKIRLVSGLILGLTLSEKIILSLPLIVAMKQISGCT